VADLDDPVYPDLSDGGDPVVDVRPDGAVDVVFAAPGPAGSALLEYPDGSAWEVDWAQPWIPVSIRLPRDLVQLPDAATAMSRHPLVGGLVGADGALFLAERIARALAQAHGPSPDSSLGTDGIPQDSGILLAGSERSGPGGDSAGAARRRRDSWSSRGVPRPADPDTLGVAVVAGDTAFDPVQPALVRVAAVVTALREGRSSEVLEPLVPALVELLEAVAGRVTEPEVALVDLDTRLELAKALSVVDSSSPVGSRAVSSLRRLLGDRSITGPPTTDPSTSDRSTTDPSARGDHDVGLEPAASMWNSPSPAPAFADDEGLDAPDVPGADGWRRYGPADQDRRVARIAAHRLLSPSAAGAPGTPGAGGATVHVVQIDDLLWSARLEGPLDPSDPGGGTVTGGRDRTTGRGDTDLQDGERQWLRVLRADDLLTLAFVPIERVVPASAVAEFVLPPGYGVDDLRFALDAPAPTRSGDRAERIRAAFDLGRTAARITRVDGPSPEATEAWEACAQAWSEAGDAARSRLARRMAMRPTTLNLPIWTSRATIADRVALAVLDPVHN